MKNRKRIGSSGSKNKTVAFNEPLERRVMLAAQAVGSIPAQSLTTGTTPSPITLSNYLDDSVIPSGDTVVKFTTSLPAPNNSFPIILTNAATPNTVANFLSYVNSGAYNDSIIHRSIPGFIIQGGGYNTSGGSIPANAAIDGESSTATLKNTTGTIAMALSTGPNSGTNEWFFNLAANPELDDTSDGGPFTAFGEVIYNGLDAINAIAAVPVYNASSSNGAWSNLPLQNFSGGSFDSSNFVAISTAVDNTPLVYSVTSSAPSKVTATITNGQLQLDPVAAGSSTITVTATDLGGGTATQTFTANVAAPGAHTVSIASASGIIGTNGAISFPVTLSAAASSAVTLNYTTVAGTAVAGDFTATSGTLTIPAGATSAAISVPIVQDSSGAAETFTVQLSSLSGNATFAGSASTLSATGTIEPAATLPTVSVGDATGTAGTDTALAFPVTLSSAASSDVTIGYATAVGTAPAGDFTSEDSTITIPAGQTTGTIDIPLVTDSTGTAETFTLAVAVRTGNAKFAGGLVSTSATGTINPASSASTGTSTAVSTVTSLAIPVQSLVPGGSTTLAASVATAAGTPVTTGSIAFIENGTTVGTVPVDSNGDAAYTQTFTATGDLAVTAEYVGVPDTFAASTSSAVTLSVSTLTPVTGKSTLPTSIVAGNATSGSTVVTVTNSQSTPAKGTVTVNVYASTTGVVDGSAILLATVKKGVKLAAGKSVTLAVPVKIPAGKLAAGTYTLLSQTIDTASNVSTAVTGPELTVGPAVVTLTGSITKLTTPSSVISGTKTKAVAVVTIANGGNSPSTSPVTISLYASTDGTVANGTLIHTLVHKGAIKQGKPITVTVPLLAYPSVADGAYSIVAAITDGAAHTVTAVSKSTVTIAAAYVDLIAKATAFVTKPKAVAAGKTASVSVTIENNANAPTTSPAVPILVQLSTATDGADPITVQTVPVKVNVAVGKTQTVKFNVTIPSDVPAGTYYLVSTVDSGNVLSEPDLTGHTVVSAVAVTLG